MAEVHPPAVFSFTKIRSEKLSDSLFRLGSWIAEHGMDAPGPYRAARDLLLRKRPTLHAGAAQELCRSDEDLVRAATRLALELDHSVLPIQGPPGAGKTYTAAQMICALVRANKKVGVTAVTHKVIRTLLEEVVKAAAKEKLTVECLHKVNTKALVPPDHIREATSYDAALDALQSGQVQVVGGTAWLWARENAAESVDVLFVDEAGQLSLADTLAVAQAGKSMVLLGDPQQLEQPQKGSHPAGVNASALQHILGEHLTIPADRGIFLPVTWRLAPSICAFTSELFYERRLAARSAPGVQRIEGAGGFDGAGLWFVPVEHDANQSASRERT